MPKPHINKAMMPSCVAAYGTIIRRILICQIAIVGAAAQGQTLTIPADPRTFSADQSSAEISDWVFTIRTDLLGEFVEREEVRSNNVATRVMEASVSGIQTTTTSITLASTDSSDVARLSVLASGTVSSNTIGLTPQATVTTLGSHTFDVTKPVFFDGVQFLTKSAYGNLQVRQFPQSVNTIASQLPLVRRIGDQIAWNEVQRRMPASDAIVVRRVADDVLPKVNSGVDKELAKLNRDWRQLRQSLDALSGSDRIRWSASSTTDSFSTSACNTSLTSRSTKSGTLKATLEAPESLVMLLSDESANRWLGGRPIAGVTVTDGTLQKLVESLKSVRENPDVLKTLLQQPDQFSADALLFSIRFADVEPLALQFADNMITIRVKFQIIPKAGEPGIMQLVNIQLRGEAAAADTGMWAIALHKLSAEPASQNMEPDLYTNMINNPVIASQIPPTTLPRTIDLQKLHPKMPLFRLHRIQSEQGQLRVSLRVYEADTVSVDRR